MFVRRWIRDIRTATKNMGPADRAEYIAEYYWYHILLAFLVIGLLALIVYHVTAGRRVVSFACIIVNETVDYERDSALSGEFAEALNLDPDRVRVDSDYRISYTGHEQKGNNESDYEKFFFGWSEGELDAIVLPESFLSYCEEVGGELRAVSEDGAVSIPLRKTKLQGRIRDDGNDPMVIVFPADGLHEEETAAFAEYIWEG